MSRRINNREFVVTFMNSTSIAEVAKAMDMSRESVGAKATQLRKLGVRLPRFARTATDRKIEVAQLNSLIDKAVKARTS